MKINNISCQQFAGVRDKKVSLQDGVNIICGENESGKSTLVNLIAKTFFQNTKIDKRTDKEFQELYFPSERKDGGVVGDSIDGKIEFETKDGSYTLEKVWGAGESCKLSTPTGVIRDSETIESVIKDVLGYGAGVYSDILFTSQKNMNTSLQTILDSAKNSDSKQEITSALSRAFYESDGVSINIIGKAIDTKLEELLGKHWDVDKDMPKKKTGRWTKECGAILDAYYKLEDAKNLLEEIKNLEEDVDDSSTEYRLKDEQVHLAEEEYNRFTSFASQLLVQNERKKAIERLNKEQAKLKDILVKWPETQDKLNCALELKTKKDNRTNLDMYENATKIVRDIDTISDGLKDKICPTKEEIKEVKSAEKNISFLENKLCGMNLNATIKMLGYHNAQIIFLRDGKPIDIGDDKIAITEAVKVIIPGVMEMKLSPADVNVEELEYDINKCKSKKTEILGKYQVNTVEELEAVAQGIAEQNAKLQSLRERLSVLLADTDYNFLKATVTAITDRDKIPDMASIEAVVRDICEGRDIASYIAVKEKEIEIYKKDYLSLDELETKYIQVEAELKEKEENLKSVEDIPEEYTNLDPEIYRAELQSKLKILHSSRDEVAALKTAAITKLEDLKDGLEIDSVVAFEDAKENFKEIKELINHWNNIKDTFENLKLAVDNNPMEGLSASFFRYLTIISEGKITSEFPDGEKLDMKVYSGENLLSYDKLSDGTKDNVAFAFRLAVLDQLFPDGGGVMVLDDPFTDMDEKRLEKSCQLVKECGKKHQIIFLTCSEKYVEMLDGNVIRM